MKGRIVASDQRGGDSITAASVVIQGASGWLVVHVDQAGTPGAVGGKAHVNEGANKDVVVHLDQPSPDGVYWLVLHVDAGEQGVYEFPGADLPVAVDGDLVMKRITLTPPSLSEARTAVGGGAAS